ncbi:MAG: MYG1 family protein [bacterium]|nr:MYG1 family protein [bacterium]
MAKMTGVSDVVFCHNAGFIAVTNSKEGAVRLAQIALAA